MFIKAVRAQLYDVLVARAQHVLLVCAADVDAVAACAQLRYCLRTDDKPHTLCVVRGVDDVRAALRANAANVGHIVFINCGAQLDLHGLGAECALDDATRYYVIDSHRPFDLDNVYSDYVHLLIDEAEEDDLNIPQFALIHDDEMMNDDDGDEATASASDKDEEENGGKCHTVYHHLQTKTT